MKLIIQTLFAPTITKLAPEDLNETLSNYNRATRRIRSFDPFQLPVKSSAEVSR